MNCFLKSALMTLATLSVVCAAEAAQPNSSNHMSRGVTCTVCHGAEMKAVPNSQTCLKCHGPVEKLAQKTERLNFMSSMRNSQTGKTVEHKALVNPHDSYHFGTTLSCSECHSEHKQSRNDCATCHDTKAWKIKDLK